MATDYDYEQGRRPRSLMRALLLVLLAFLAGLVAMGYAFSRSDSLSNLLRREPPVQAEVTIPPARALATTPQPFAVVPEPGFAAGAVEARIDQIESRLNQIDSRTQAAAGNADRAEALLVAFAARRALDRGADLGYIESLLRERFGASQPRAIATIIGASRQPVTLDELQTSLNEIAPRLVAPGPGGSWWEGVRRELATLIVVRKAEQPSAQPADRLTRARSQLAAGHVDRALAEVTRLPGRTQAEDWIAKARRYVSARAALDIIETVALLQPRGGPAPVVSAPPPPAIWPAPRPEETTEEPAPAPAA